MASVVCQGLQSCLEPRLIEPLVLQTPLLQTLKIQESSLTNVNGGKDKNSNGDHKIKRGWSFLDVLENPSSQTKNHAKIEQVYVHPTAKRSASALSTKSLEMCTESLGSESGSDVSENGDGLSSFSWEEREIGANQKSKSRLFGRKMQNDRRVDFPPPLTSISGSGGSVKVRHHREGGRLVIKAVSTSNFGTNFQAERTNGRLRLSLLKDCSVNCNSGWFVKEKAYNVEGGEVEIVKTGEEDEGWGMDVNKGKGGVEIGNKELKRSTRSSKGLTGFEKRRVSRTRCKQGVNGNKIMANWSSFCVAIS